MRDILQNRLLSVLREGENIVYSPYASLFYNGLPQQVFYFDLSASVDFKNTEKVENLIKQIIKELRTNKVDEDELEALKKSFLVTKRKVLSDEASAEWRTNLVNLLKMVSLLLILSSMNGVSIVFLRWIFRGRSKI